MQKSAAKNIQTHAFAIFMNLGGEGVPNAHPHGLVHNAGGERLHGGRPRGTEEAHLAVRVGQRQDLLDLGATGGGAGLQFGKRTFPSMGNLTCQELHNPPNKTPPEIIPPPEDRLRPNNKPNSREGKEKSQEIISTSVVRSQTWMQLGAFLEF